MTEATIFAAALEKATAKERAAYLAEACGGDERLRLRLEALLRAHNEPDDLLDCPVVTDAEVAGEAIDEGPGRLIGPYKLLEQIGEGGFGVVFMAEQQQPVRRKVAVKILKPGMDTRQVIARFEAERQALALMDHPNIARVFDGGQTASGRPYFVMELVRGVPITEFCDQNHLAPRERLELFLHVCQAVQHAHQKGIIHRDLKPSNILVTLHDGVPAVKVIDFGIAKALGQQLTDKTLFTNFAQMIGTPMYTSPEQAQLSGLDVDTRADIYALGVLLYELLTGTTPFDQERLRRVAYDEMRRIIREEEPPKPSTRLSTLRKAASAVSGNRQSDVKRLRQLFRGELDWIVMKALEKDRNRRYETASAFAADVQRFLRDEPVQACPPSKWYRLRKLVRRNKGTFATVFVLVVAVLVAVITLAASNVMIRDEQERTREEKERAEGTQKLAEERAEQIRDGLERLKTASALLERGRWYITESRWDDAHAALSQAVRLRSDYASAWAERGDLHTRLGLWELAADDFAHELAARQPDSTGRWYLHALLNVFLGETDEYHQVTRQMRERFHGTSYPLFLLEVVRASVLRPEADEDREQWVALAEHAVASRPRGDWFALYVLGLAHYRAGQHEQAARRLRESLEADQMGWSPRHLSHAGLAMAHQRLGQTAEARQELQAAAHALDHWTEEMYQNTGDKRWVSHLGATGYWPVAWWDWLEGRLFYQEAKLLIDGSPPPDDPRIHVLRARGFVAVRGHVRAESEYAAALKRLPGDPQIRLEALRNRGYGSIQVSNWKRAAAAFTEASELQPEDVYFLLFSAVAHLAAGEIDAYRERCAVLMQRFEKTTDPEIARDVLLACVLRPDAIPDKARLLPLARAASPPDHFGPPEAGAALYRAGKYEEAIRSFEAAEKTYRPRALAWCFLAMAQQRLGHTTDAHRALNAAVHWIAEANGQPLDDPAATRAAWGSWHEHIECRLLLSEAKQLLNQGAGQPH